MTIKISELSNLTTVLANVQIPMVANVAGTLTTVKGNVGQLTDYILGTSGADYANIVANAAVQAGQIATLTSNAASQAGAIADIYSNLAVKSGEIADLQANAATQAGQLATLTANAAAQAGELATLTANAGAQSGDLSTLTSNAAVQAGVLATLTSNAAAQAGELATLTANAAAQAGLIANISTGVVTFGNVIPSANVTYSLGSPSAQWKDLYLSGSTIFIGGAQLSVANGAIQSSVPITADIAANTLNVADTQITFSQGSFIEETAVIGQPGVYGLALNSPDDGIVGLNALDANASVMSSVIVSNVSVQVNVQNTSDPANVHIWQYIEDGSLLWPDFTVQSTAFTSNIATTITNTESNVTVLQGNVTDIYANLGAVSGSLDDLDANAAVQADLIQFLRDNGNIILGNIANLESSVSSLESNTAFTMANSQHWTSNVSTINDALNQLAQRLYNIENP